MKIDDMVPGKLYRVARIEGPQEFSHASATGLAILHAPGEPDMQSCFTAPPEDCSPVDNAAPTLHGLTLVQLEAVRGYVETVGSVARMMAMSKALAKAGSPVSLLDRRPIAQWLAAARALAESPNGTPYSEGARFALAQESIAESIATIETKLREAR